MLYQEVLSPNDDYTRAHISPAVESGMELTARDLMAMKFLIKLAKEGGLQSLDEGENLISRSQALINSGVSITSATLRAQLREMETERGAATARRH
jgi:hypothetical protein